MSEQGDLADVRWETEGAWREVGAALAGADRAGLTSAVRELTTARRIACYAGGREGLMLRALAMRLFHAGLDVHVVGDMTTPPVTTGDLLVLSSGPGNISTVTALATVASSAGARVLYFTAQPTRRPAELADTVVVLPAQTMADDAGSAAVLPMGSTYEIALLVLGDLITAQVRQLRGETVEQMRARHTNLE